MCADRKASCIGVRILPSLFAWAGTSLSVYAQSATRDLSDYSSPGVAFSVSIAIDVPPGTIAAGVEESPPVGWSVSDISDDGSWDAQSEEVKWGPFFDPSIPSLVTYDVTPPPDAAGEACFAGTVSFGGPVQPVEGDKCLVIAIPALSDWGLAAMGLLVLAAGIMLLARRHAPHT